MSAAGLHKKHIGKYTGRRPSPLLAPALKKAAKGPAKNAAEGPSAEGGPKPVHATRLIHIQSCPVMEELLVDPTSPDPQSSTPLLYQAAGNGTPAKKKLRSSPAMVIYPPQMCSSPACGVDWVFPEGWSSPSLLPSSASPSAVANPNARKLPHSQTYPNVYSAVVFPMNYPRKESPPLLSSLESLLLSPPTLHLHPEDDHESQHYESGLGGLGSVVEVAAHSLSSVSSMVFEAAEMASSSLVGVMGMPRTAGLELLTKASDLTHQVVELGRWLPSSASQLLATSCASLLPSKRH